MTQLDPLPFPEHHYMSGGLPAMDFGGISPRQEFINPFPAGARKSRQMDYDDIPQRISAMNLADDRDDRKRSQSRKRSVSRPSLMRSSTVGGISQQSDYEQFRFEKVGEDWTEAKRTQILTSQKDLRKKAKNGKSKNGTVLAQLTTMVDTRRSQIDELIEDKNHETGLEWEPVYIEEVQAGINRTTGKKSVLVMDVIVARAGLVNDSRPSLAQVRTNSIYRNNSNARPNSIFRSKSTSQPTSILRRSSMSASRADRGGFRNRNNSWERYSDGGKEKKNKDKEGGSGKLGGGKTKEVVDPDPFGQSKLFAPSGKPLDTTSGAPIPFDEVVLPPHIKEDEPIGRKLSKRRNGKSPNGDGAADTLEILDVDGIFPEGGAADVLGKIDFDSILPKSKSKSKGKKGGASRSRSKSRATNNRNRSRSKSQNRSQAHAEHRGKRGQRVDRYMDEHDSHSSDHGSGRSVFLDDDDDTSYTSSSIHRDMDRRGSLHRRGSSKNEKHHYREHYRGPARDSRGYLGEQIMIPQRAPRRLSTSYAQPQPKAITYGEPWYSGDRVPDHPRSPSPRRREYGVPALLYPHQLREEDQRSERLVDNYMERDRLEELRLRELDEREKALERRERELRRISTYGNPYVRGGRYQ